MGLLIEDVTKKEGACGPGPDQDHPVASEPLGVGVCAPVLSGPGTRQHRVHRPPVRPCGGGGPAVRPCGGGGPAGLGGQRHRGHRRRPRVVGALGRQPGRVQGGGGPGVPGGGRCHLRPGGLPPGALLGGSVQAAGACPPDRDPGDRCRRHLRPGRLQRPAPAGPQGPDVGGGAAHPGRTPPGSQAGRRLPRRPAFRASGGPGLRRRGSHRHRPGSGGAGRAGRCLRCLCRDGVGVRRGGSLR